MREIKFRAWDKNHKEMIILENSGLQYFDFEESYSLGFTVDGYSEFWAHEQYQSVTRQAAKFPIMQYTGLKDKNGKEIYERDIVKTHSWTKENKRLIGQVVYQLSSFHIEGVKQYKWCCCDMPHYDMEIIGNIYENPDLLGA